MEKEPELPEGWEPPQSEAELKERLEHPYRPRTRPVQHPGDSPNSDWFYRFDC